MRPLALALLLTGCVAMKEHNANRYDSYALCFVAAAGDQTEQIAARNVLQQRGFTCRPEHIELGMQSYNQTKAMSDASRKAAALELSYRLLAPPQPQAQMCQFHSFGQGQATMVCR